MEPRLARGDLVVVRAGNPPEVGNVVLYRNAQLGVRVLHRVIGRDGARLVLKGDANDFVDDAHPLPRDVTGSLWFSIPRAGSALLWLREPMHAALLAFLLALVALAGGGAARPAARKELSPE
jgi:signal peptidase I